MKGQINFEKYLINVVDNACKYFTENNIKSMVLGISGGIDSTITAYLANKVQRQIGVKLYGISLPSATNEVPENNSANLAFSFCSEYKVISIQEIYEQFLNFVDNSYADHLQNGNIKARIRMMYLYNFASLHNGVVLDTDNLTEHNLGFWTLHGDEGDVNFIGNLWKSEIYDFARWILENDETLTNKQVLAIKEAIDITPTDGNGVKEGGDIAQIAPGCTFKQIDQVLIRLDAGCNPLAEVESNDLNKKYRISYESILRILRRFNKSHYKRLQRPKKFINRDSFIY